jgi:putative transposase
MAVSVDVVPAAVAEWTEFTLAETIRDRAGQFTSSFDAVFLAEGIRILASPPQALRANAICERMIGTLRRELLDRMLIVSEHHLRRVLTEYLLHYNDARLSLGFAGVLRDVA